MNEKVCMFNKACTAKTNKLVNFFFLYRCKVECLDVQQRKNVRNKMFSHLYVLSRLLC